MFGVALIPSVLLALGMAFSPESPRWLFQVFSAIFSVFILGYWLIGDGANLDLFICSKGKFLKLKWL